MNGAATRRAIVGALVAAVAAVLVALLAWSVQAGGRVAALDSAVIAWTGAHATPDRLQLAATVSRLHRPRGIAWGTAAAAAWLLWRWRAGLPFLLLGVGGGATLNHLVKHAIQRPRPGADAVMAVASDFSFPSGHVANACLLYGALALLAVCRARSRAMKLGALAGATLLVGLVAASRLALGAHHLSDVVAGALVGVGWLALCSATLSLWPGPKPKSTA